MRTRREALGHGGGNSSEHVKVLRPFNLEGEDCTRTRGMGGSMVSLDSNEGKRHLGGGGGIGAPSWSERQVVIDKACPGEGTASLARTRNCIGKGDVNDFEAGIRLLGEALGDALGEKELALAGDIRGSIE